MALRETFYLFGRLWRNSSKSEIKFTGFARITTTPVRILQKYVPDAFVNVLWAVDMEIFETVNDGSDRGLSGYPGYQGHHARGQYFLPFTECPLKRKIPRRIKIESRFIK